MNIDRDWKLYAKYLKDKEKYDKSRTNTSNGSNDR